MRIVLLGHGVIGRKVEDLAAVMGHDVVLTVGADDPPLSIAATAAEVAIEFAGPDGAETRIREAIEVGLPIVSGSTGWGDGLAAVEALVRDRDGALLHAPNLSLGVAVFERIVRSAGRLLDVVPEYRIELEETHHVRKVDHPSGTARWLAEGLVSRVARLDRWEGDLVTAESAPDQDGVLPVRSYREGDVPGTHVVRATGVDDVIELRHQALRRDGFARGAIRAAEWLRDRRGVYTLDDMLDDLLASHDPPAP